MDAQKVDMFLMANSKYFESHHLIYIRERLMQMDDSKSSALSVVKLSDPTTTLIVSILIGGAGIDRFMIGDTGVGIAKLISFGGCGLWWFIDIFLIQKATREKNMREMQKFLY
jgi:TM2 domain-containing membrane protein YozV